MDENCGCPKGLDMHNPDCFTERNLLAEKDAEISKLQDEISRLTIESSELREIINDLIVFAIVWAEQQRSSAKLRYFNDSHARMIFRAYSVLEKDPRREWVQSYISPEARKEANYV